VAKPVQGKYHFDLWSNNVVVECFTEGPARFAMNLSDGSKRYAFRGDAINVRHLVIGTLLSVVPDPDPEQPTWFNFSLLLPFVAGFDPPQTQERLTTIGIHSTEPNPNIGGIPPSGILNYFGIVHLAGTVAWVEDLPTKNCSEWSAKRTIKPGSSVHWLRVSAPCAVPRPGVALALKRAEPEDSDPEHLLLRLSVEERTEPADTSTTVYAYYAVRTDSAYRTVTILPDGPSMAVTEVPEVPEDPQIPLDSPIDG
jgi:hypothetical protein